MKQTIKIHIGILCGLLTSFSFVQVNAASMNITEGFEDPSTIFSYSTTGSVSYDVQNTEASRTGVSSFKVNPSSCWASCFDSYRVDLLYTFAEPTLIQGISFWAREDSTSGSGWGGKIKVSSDSVWDPTIWGVVGNGKPITGDWQFIYVPINDITSNIDIRVWDITSSSSMWLDDITIDVAAVPIPAASWLLFSGLVGLIAFGKKQANTK